MRNLLSKTVSVLLTISILSLSLNGISLGENVKDVEVRNSAQVEVNEQEDGQSGGTSLMSQAKQVSVLPSGFYPSIEDSNWINNVGALGVSNNVNSVHGNDSGDMYIAGSFAGRMKYWDGERWEFLPGTHEDASAYNTVHMVGDDVYVSGSDTIGGMDVNSIALWDGTDWNTLGGGLNGVAYAMDTDSLGNLYVGGTFTQAGGVEANRIAMWDGENWSALGTGLDANVRTIAIDSDDNVYVGGEFTAAGGVANTGKIAMWDGDSWSDVGEGVNNTVFALHLDNANNLYAGGAFTAHGLLATELLRIGVYNSVDGWQALGAGITGGNVNAIEIMDDGSIVAGGAFNNAGGAGATRIAYWDGDSWNTMGTGTASTINSMYYNPTTDILYVGGNFTTAGGKTVNRIAQWSESTWSAVGYGLDGKVNAMAFDSLGNLYFVGAFTRIGDLTVNRVAMWDGEAFSALGTGAGAEVQDIAIDSNDNVYIGGNFSSVGGVANTDSIAMWDGDSWNSVGGGYINDTVYSLAIDSNDLLYASGWFWDEVSFATGAAVWDGDAWSVLGGGLDGTAYEMIVGPNDEIYMTGEFNTGYDNVDDWNEITLNKVAMWDGQWNAFGTGIATNNEGHAIAMDDEENIYVGGSFTIAGGAAGDRIVMWDGDGWSEVGGGADNQIWALILQDDGTLYSGGRFTNIGDTAINFLARWDGDTWSDVNPTVVGNNGWVYDLMLGTDNSVFTSGAETFPGQVSFGGFINYCDCPMIHFNLEYDTDGNGSISGETTQAVEFGSNGESLTAVPSTGYEFDAWSDASTANPRVDTNVMSDLAVTATFEIKTYTLSYSADAGGTITGSKNQSVTHGANGTKVTAVPNSGYQFVKWSDNVSTAARTDLSVTANKSVSASFSLIPTTTAPVIQEKEKEETEQELVSEEEDVVDIDTPPIASSDDVRIKLVDKDGNPIIGAKVTIKGTDQEELTDENGFATFSGLKDGDYEIEYEYKGKTKTAKLEVKGESDQLATVEIVADEGTSVWWWILLLGLLTYLIYIFYSKTKYNE